LNTRTPRISFGIRSPPPPLEGVSITLMLGKEIAGESFHRCLLIIIIAGRLVILPVNCYQLKAHGHDYTGPDDHLASFNKYGQLPQLSWTASIIKSCFNHQKQFQSSRTASIIKSNKHPQEPKASSKSICRRRWQRPSAILVLGRFSKGLFYLV